MQQPTYIYMKETLVYSNSNPVAGTISQTEELTSHSIEY